MTPWEATARQAGDYEGDMAPALIVMSNVTSDLSFGRFLVAIEPFLQSRDGLTWCYRSAYSNPRAVAAALTSRRIINREILLEW